MKCVMAIFILLILVMGCAPSGNTVQSQPQTPVAVDNKSTSSLTTIPSTPAETKATPPNVSFPSKTYTNDEYKFIVLYPDSWRPAERQQHQVFKAENSNRVSVSVAVFDTDYSANQTVNQNTESNISHFNQVSSENITLADGITKGLLQNNNYYAGGNKYISLSLSVIRGLKTVAVVYNAREYQYNENEAKEIVTSLTFE